MINSCNSPKTNRHGFNNLIFVVFYLTLESCFKVQKDRLEKNFSGEEFSNFDLGKKSPSKILLFSNVFIPKELCCGNAFHVTAGVVRPKSGSEIKINLKNQVFT